MPRLRSGARRGFALADFMAGTLIFAGVVGVFVSLTNSKFGMLQASELRTRALFAAEDQVDRIRALGLGGGPAGMADAEGFRRVRTFEPVGSLYEGLGEVRVRALRMAEGQDSRQLYEARVTVSWRGQQGIDRLSLSTVATLPREGGR